MPTICGNPPLAFHLAVHRDDPSLAASYARIAFIDQDASGIAGAKTLSSLCPHSPRLVDVLGENPICTASSFVVRRDWFLAVGGFDPRLSHAEDQDFVARIVSRGGRIGVDAVLTGYRFSPDGLSMELQRMHEGWRKVAALSPASRWPRWRRSIAAIWRGACCAAGATLRGAALCVGRAEAGREKLPCRTPPRAGHHRGGHGRAAAAAGAAAARVCLKSGEASSCLNATVPPFRR
jgi:hypothetical protein